MLSELLMHALVKTVRGHKADERRVVEIRKKARARPPSLEGAGKQSSKSISHFPWV